MISEDGTALQMRLDITYRKGKILVFGLSGGSFEVVSMAEFMRATRGPACRTLASSLYAYTLIPVAEGAPHIPFFAWCHDSTNATFSSKIAIQVWQYLWQVSIVHQYSGNVQCECVVHVACTGAVEARCPALWPCA